MRIAIYIYVALYSLYTVWTIADDIREKPALWETVSDAVLLSLGLVGMILYQAEVADAAVKSVWKVASVLLVAGQVAVNVYTRR